MDKNYLINEYLQGKHPIEGESWDLPTDSELERDTALYDALLAERRASKQRKLPIVLRWITPGIAACILLLIGFSLLMKKGDSANKKPVVTEVIGQETIEQNAMQPVPDEISEDKEEEPQKPQETDKFPEAHKPQHRHRQLATVGVPSATESVNLSTTADSLYYYLTQLENEMGECRDSTCLAELTSLMRADERIKGLVNKIIHKQVETAYEEEYLVDTTTHYVPL